MQRANNSSAIYHVNGNEEQLFRLAFSQRLPVMLTGPTGCGKTRFIEYMGEKLDRPVMTISCHDDLTSSDLVGRFMVTGGDVIFRLPDRPLKTFLSQVGANLCFPSSRA